MLDLVMRTIPYAPFRAPLFYFQICALLLSMLVPPCAAVCIPKGVYNTPEPAFAGVSYALAPVVQHGHSCILVTPTGCTTSLYGCHTTNGVYIDVHIELGVGAWFGLSECERFDKAFRLLYNRSIDLYLDLTVLQHCSKLKANGIIFQDARISAAESVDVFLSNDAFCSQANFLHGNQKQLSEHLLLCRESKETSTVPGKVLPKHIHLAVDWRRSHARVSRCEWDVRATEMVFTILLLYQEDVQDSCDPSPQLSTKHIFGIVIAVVAIVHLLIALAWHLWKRRFLRTAGLYKRTSSTPRLNAWVRSETFRPASFSDLSDRASLFPEAELPGESSNARYSDNASDTDVIGQSFYEMMGHEHCFEIGGGQIPDKELDMMRERAINGVDPSSAPVSILPCTTKGSVPYIPRLAATTTDSTEDHSTVCTLLSAVSTGSLTDLLPYPDWHQAIYLEDSDRERLSFESHI